MPSAAQIQMLNNAAQTGRLDMILLGSIRARDEGTAIYIMQNMFQQLTQETRDLLIAHDKQLLVELGIVPA